MMLIIPISVIDRGNVHPQTFRTAGCIGSYRGTSSGLKLRPTYPPVDGDLELAVVMDSTQLELYMERSIPMESASAFIDEKIKQLGDWRGKTLARVRAIIHEADPEIVEAWKWVKPTTPGTPVWSHGSIVCTGETYKNHVKMTFAKAIDIHEGDKVDEAALKDLIRAAVALNLKGKSKPKPRRASSKRAD